MLQDKRGRINATIVPRNMRLTKYTVNDILIGNIRPYLKKIWFANVEGGTNGDVLVITVNHNFKETINNKYLYYVLSSNDFFSYDSSHAKGAKMPRGDKIAIMNYVFSLPKIEEQNRIVTILDRFDKLCNDITEGLPAEIEARKKQYEYYRDKLLRFEKNGE